MAALLRSSVRRLSTAPVRRGAAFSTDAAPAPWREGAIIAAAVAGAGSGLGLWLMPPGLADSREAKAGQISAAAAAGVEERNERRRRFLLGVPKVLKMQREREREWYAKRKMRSQNASANCGILKKSADPVNEENILRDKQAIGQTGVTQIQYMSTEQGVAPGDQSYASQIPEPHSS